MAEDESVGDLAAAGLATEGGVASAFPSRAEAPFAVAPSTSGKPNTLRKLLRPAACWRIDDLRFHFDSSFILPEAVSEFGLLSGIRPPTAVGDAAFLLSVFGHADPSGDDDYNKQLSGRRATAVYALLVRDAALWEELYSNASGGDAWSIAQIQIMLQQLGQTSVPNSGKLDPPTSAGVKAFQSENGLQPSGNPGSDTRKALFLQYMDSICQNESGPFRYQKADFLSRGASAQGKGDRQGCSEFNPILVFSKEQAKAFEDPKKKSERDADNLSNRRVVVYMFAPSLGIDSTRWPCPTVKEGVAGCKAQFFSDGNERRSPQDGEREYLKRGRTVACKFYDQLARNSPCEAVRQNLKITLLGADGLPSRNAPYLLTTGAQSRKGVTDADGVLFQPQVLAGLTCQIEWGVSDDPGTGAILPNFAEIFLNAADADPDPDLAARQLSNLGFQRGEDSLNRQAFKFEYNDPDDSDQAIDTAHTDGKPKQQRFTPA